MPRALRHVLLFFGAGALLAVVVHLAAPPPEEATPAAARPPTATGGILDHFSSDPILDRLDRLVLEERYLEAFNESVIELGTRTRRLGPEDAGTLRSLQWTGAIAMLGGDRRSAGDLFDALLAIRRRSLPPDDPVLAETLLHRGRVARLLGDDDLAARCVEEARQILAARGRGGPLWPSLLQARANLDRRTNLEAARRGYLEALRLRRVTDLTPEAAVIDNLTWLAWTLDRLGRPDEGLPYLEEGRLRLRNLGLAGSGLDATLAQLEADDLAARGRWDAAEPLYAATAASNVSRRNRYLGGFARRVCPPDGFEALALAALGRGEGDRAWSLLERARAATHRDFAAFAMWRDRAPGSFREVRALRTELAGLTRRLDQHLRSRDDTAWSDDSWPLTLRALEIRARVASLEAGYLDTVGDALPTLDETRASLPPRTALIGWLEVDVGGGPTSISRPRRSWGYLYVLRRTGPVRWAALWDAPVPPDLETRRSEWGAVFARVRRAAEWPLRVDADPILLDQLRDWTRHYLDPALPFLDGVDHLVIEGTRLPVELFRDPQGRFLVDRFDISYTPSAAFLAILAQRPRRDAHRTPRSILSLAAGGGAGVAAQVPAGTARALRQSRTTFARGEVALDRLPRLPFAAVEAKEVARRFPVATVLEGGPGVESGVRRLAEAGRLREYDIIHIAAHTLVDGAPERCGLALAEHEPDALSEDDGVLDAEEVFLGWNLDAGLLTLSACESARPAGATRGEDLGFAPALFAAGAQRVLLSLWPVDDRATAMLMDRFYANLVGDDHAERPGGPGGPLPAAAALREAKIHLREWTDATGQRPFEHPAYWAGFILIGRLP